MILHKIKTSIIILLVLLSPFLLASLEDFLNTLKFSKVIPNSAYLDKAVKVKRHSLTLLKYPILLPDKIVGYLLVGEKGKIEEFSVVPFPEKFIMVKGFPRYPFFLNSHATSSAILLDYLGFREKEDTKTFIASLNIFLEKCLCGQPGQPLIYDIAEGLKNFAEYKKRRIIIEEICKSSNPGKALSFYIEKIKKEEPMIVSFIYGKEANKLESARERRQADTYLGVGYIELKGELFLVLWDAQMEGFIAKSWESLYTNLLIIRVRTY